MGWKDKKKPPVPPVEIHQIGVSVRDKSGNGLSNAIGIIIPDTYDVPIIGVNTGGRIIFTIDNKYPWPDWGYNATFGCDGFKDYKLRIVPIDSTSYDIVLEPDQIILPKLIARGQFFALANGQPFTCIECSDFDLYNKFLLGIDIGQVLKQRMEIGFNTVRIFGIGFPRDLLPSDFPNNSYYNRLQDFYNLLASYNLYGEFTAFAGTRRILKVDDQLAYWNKLVESLKPITNCLLEAVNEHEILANRVESLQQLPRPVGVISSHGSSGMAPGGANGAPPVTPYWDYATFHTNDSFEWQRKVGHNSMEIWNGPTLANENTRAPDHFQSKALAFDAAAGAALLCAGSCFHSVHGKTSDLFDGLELELARAWVKGARSVPLSCQLGNYRHDAVHIQMEIDKNLMRVYQRGNDSACLVEIRK